MFNPNPVSFLDGQLQVCPIYNERFMFKRKTEGEESDKLQDILEDEIFGDDDKSDSSKVSDSSTE